MNLVVLTGRLGKDPELRYVGEGNTAVCNTSLATDRYMGKDKDKKTDWHNLQIWGKRGEYFGQATEKGSKVTVIGEIHYDSYEKEGDTKWITRINVRDFDIANPITVDQVSQREGEDKGSNVVNIDSQQDIGDDAFGSDDDVPF